MIFNFKSTSDAKTLGGKTADEFAKSGHEHKVAEITDFPEAMPASDVKAWAKADTKPAYTAAEVGALPTTGGKLTSLLHIVDADTVPLILEGTHSSGLYSFIQFRCNNTLLGLIGFNGVDTPVFETISDHKKHNILHTGNSAKVHIGTAAPSDTSALWVDISA